MSDTNYFLRKNVMMEPLINRWYAWTMLLFPPTLALIIKNWHLRIMESYLKSPKMHANAVKNPRMIGGPFIDVPGDQSAAVKALMDKTLSECGDLMILEKAIKELDAMLASEAKGNSLRPFYGRIADELKGFVELGYDLNNNPSMRLIEALFYKSPFYDKSRQSIQLMLVECDERPFTLSTPRFPGPGKVELAIPFDSETLDRLFAMREIPQPLSHIADLMPKDADQRTLFTSFFTETPPELSGRDRAEITEGIRVRYYGHATLVIESANCTIMSDPIVSYPVEDQTVPRYTYEDLPEVIDYVVLTHNHQDHVLFETLIPLRHKIRHIVVPRSNGGMLQDPSLRHALTCLGFDSVIELDELQSVPVPDGAITGLPFFGEHGDLHIRSKLAIHIQLNGRSLVCAADSNNLSPEMYHMVREIMGPVDRLFLGMECEGAPMSWLYGPLMTKPLERRQDQERRLDGTDCEGGISLIEGMGCKELYIYAMGQEPWLTFVSSIAYNEKSKPIVESNRLIEDCRAKGIPAERLYGRKEMIW